MPGKECLVTPSLFSRNEEREPKKQKKTDGNKLTVSTLMDIAHVFFRRSKDARGYTFRTWIDLIAVDERK